MKLVKLIILLVFSGCAFIFFGAKPDDLSRYKNWKVKTAPIIIYGDTRTGNIHHKNLVKTMLKVKPKIVFHAGDFVEQTDPKSWNRFFKTVQPLLKATKYYPVKGNHEKWDEQFLNRFSSVSNLPYYTTIHDSIKFIVIDSNIDISKNSIQYKWLVKQLQNTKNTLFTIVIGHHPVFSSGPHVINKTYQTNLKKLFAKHKVDLFFCAHNHSYEKSIYKNTTYIVTAGGGAPLYPKTKFNPYSKIYLKARHFCTIKRIDNMLYLEAIATNLKLIDKFAIKARRKN